MDKDYEKYFYHNLDHDDNFLEKDNICLNNEIIQIIQENFVHVYPIYHQKNGLSMDKKLL